MKASIACLLARRSCAVSVLTGFIRISSLPGEVGAEILCAPSWTDFALLSICLQTPRGDPILTDDEDTRDGLGVKLDEVASS